MLWNAETPSPLLERTAIRTVPLTVCTESADGVAALQGGYAAASLRVNYMGARLPPGGL